MTTAPIARLALAYGAGVTAGLMAVPVPVAVLTLVGSILWPSQLSRGLISLRAALLLTAASGTLAGFATRAAEMQRDTSTCVAREVLRGRFLAPPLTDRARLVRHDDCGELTVVLRSSEGSIPGGHSIRAGQSVRVRGAMREGTHGPWFSATAIEPDVGADHAAPWLRLRWSMVRFRGELVRAIHRVYGERGPLVTALTLARTEGLTRDVRDAFAGAGIAHILAISGFHVGIVAALVSALLRAVPWGLRRRRLTAAVVTSGYVALIGFPTAACRAALILGLTSFSIYLGRVPSRWGALGTAALVMLWFEPSDISGAGFQLSFAGAAGLIAWARPLELWLRKRLQSRIPHLPASILSGVAGAVAATVATLPFVAWHFQRVAVLGIPATLIATPLISLALPGALISIPLFLVWPVGGAALAGGVSILLDGLAFIAKAFAELPFANVWVSSWTVAAAGLGCLLAIWTARRPGVGAWDRRRLMLIFASAAVLGWPGLLALEGRGSVDLWMIDVGQGDAVAIRSPGGSWMLVDAGPPSTAEVPAQPVVRTLRSLGVTAIDVLVLTHPDADHIGGVPGVLQAFSVRRILDPSLPVGKQLYADVMVDARTRRIPWTQARAGQHFTLDGLAVEVLHPPDSDVAAALASGHDAEANHVSVVLRVSWRDIEILLTGDAYANVEESLGERLGDIDILKVGHHGSLTSTSPAFLRAAMPEHALISSGRSNRYGHPAPLVLARLSDVRARIHRTDLHGTVVLRVSGDGHVRVRTDR